MKRVILRESVYIDLSDEKYNNCKNTNVIDEKTGELLFTAKNVQLDRYMVLIVPLTEFKDIDE